MYITFYQPVKHTPIPESELSPDDFLRMLEGEHVEIPQEIPQEIVPRKKITVNVESCSVFVSVTLYPVPRVIALSFVSNFLYTNEPPGAFWNNPNTGFSVIEL